MQGRVTSCLFLLLMAVGYGAGAASTHSGVNNLAASFGAAASGGVGIMARISSSMTEPVGLVLMGVCLIGLSVVVRRRSRKRSR